MSKIIKEIISNAVGPAPWYWKTFPVIKGSSGSEFAWSFHEKEWLVSLGLKDKPGEPRLVANIYTREEINKRFENRIFLWLT